MLDTFDSSVGRKQVATEEPVPDSLLRPGPISAIRFDITTRCNLRCVYCEVSQNHYHGRDMPEALVNVLVGLVTNLAKHEERLDPIDMNGHGETTMVPGWTDICIRLLQQGIPIRLQTNLSKRYTKDEFEVLACMSDVAISIDTADRDLLRRMRRKVDVQQIVTNVAMIRAAALRLYRKPPNIIFACGLYDKNTPFAEDFANFAIAVGVHRVVFWNLFPFPNENSDVSPKDYIYPLDSLEQDELRPRMIAIRGALNILRRNGIHVSMPGDFIERLNRRAGLDG